jgi:hypothetical protein
MKARVLGATHEGRRARQREACGELTEDCGTAMGRTAQHSERLWHQRL